MTDKILLKFQSSFTKLQTLSDKSLKLEFITQEIAGEDVAKLLDLRGQIGWCVFAPAGIKEDDIPTEPIEDTKKSMNERIRGALWVLHEKKGGKPEDFPLYKEKMLTWFLEHIKGKIQEYE